MRSSSRRRHETRKERTATLQKEKDGSNVEIVEITVNKKEMGSFDEEEHVGDRYSASFAVRDGTPQSRLGSQWPNLKSTTP